MGAVAVVMAGMVVYGVAMPQAAAWVEPQVVHKESLVWVGAMDVAMAVVDVAEMPQAEREVRLEAAGEAEGLVMVAPQMGQEGQEELAASESIVGR